MDAGPVPLEFALTLSHGALDTAVHVHCDGRVRLRLVVPPFEPNVTGVGVITGTWQEPALCITVNVAGPIRTVPETLPWVELFCPTTPVIVTGEEETTPDAGVLRVMN
jgi:hypothetical protein